MSDATVGSLHVVWRDPSYATTKCHTDVITYELPSEALVKSFATNPAFGLNVSRSLALEIRGHTMNHR